MQPNPMYPKGKERFRDTAILTLSPFAQAEYATYLLYETHDTVKPNSSLIFCNFPYRLDFILIDAIECACIPFVGIWILGKQAHKYFLRTLPHFHELQSISLAIQFQTPVHSIMSNSSILE